MPHIAFYEPGFSYRGTTKAMAAYAGALLKFTNYTAEIIFDPTIKTNNYGYARHLLSAGINVVPATTDELKRRARNLDLLYYISSGGVEDCKWLKDIPCKTFLHQVGHRPPDYSSSTYFAYNGFWSSLYYTGMKATVLPHIIKKNTSSYSEALKFREHCGIPESAILLGRHGGLDTWNYAPASEAVHAMANKRDDLYFLFLGTQKFAEHPRIKFLDICSDPMVVDTFILACDAMLHARWEGETFGLACAEFLSAGKPIITWSGSRERNHLFLADRSAIVYEDKLTLSCILGSLTKEYLQQKSAEIPKHLLDRCGEEYTCKTFLDIISYET